MDEPRRSGEDQGMTLSIPSRIQFDEAVIIGRPVCCPAGVCSPATTNFSEIYE